MATRKQKIIAPTHLTVSEFARQKKVSRTSVFNHIKDGLIVADLVGKEQVPMIDWETYKEHEFAPPKWSKETIKAELQKEMKDGK